MSDINDLELPEVGEILENKEAAPKKPRFTLPKRKAKEEVPTPEGVQATTPKPKKVEEAKSKFPVGFMPSANFLPKSRRTVIEAQQAKVLWRRVVIGSFLVALVAGAGAFGFKQFSQVTYDGALNAQTGLDFDISQYNEVALALGVQGEVQDRVSDAVGSEVLWAAVMEKVQRNLPSGASASNMVLTSGGATAGSTAVAATLQISSTQPIAYSELYYAFLNEPGVTDLTIGNLASSGGAEGTVYTYPISFGVDTSVLTNRFVEQVDQTETLIPAPGELLAPPAPGEVTTEDPLGLNDTLDQEVVTP